MAEYQAGLDAILQTCLHAIETQGWTVEDCLDHFASYRNELEPLLKAAGQYRPARHMSPSLAFRERAMPRLSARLKQSARPGLTPSLRQNVQSRPKTGHRPSYAQRRFAIGFIALIVLLGLAATTTGTIYAAGSALPGDTLYPVEQTVEQLQLTFTSPGKAIGLRMDFAEKRLDEAEQLRQKGDGGHMQEALDSYHLLVSDATQMIGSGSEANDPALLDMLSTRLALQQARLQALLSSAPPAAQAGLTTAIEASKRGQKKAAQAIKDHGSGKPGNVPGRGGPGNAAGGGSLNVTPPGQDSKPPADNANGAPVCSSGTPLSGDVISQLHQLANEYKTPYSVVQDLFCSGLTVEQVEAQLSSVTPAKGSSGGGNGKGNGDGNGAGKP